MKNYITLPAEEIPECCGSCEHVRYNKNIVFCTEHIYENVICIFGLCDEYKRKGVEG